MSMNNEHLIDNFRANNETKELARQLLRTAKVAMAEGSGRALGALATGLPAVCMLLAAESLKSDDVTDSTAQPASCLDRRKFRRACDAVRAALEEYERNNCIPYDTLYGKYKVAEWKQDVHEYVLEAENQLMFDSDQDSETSLFRCAVFFWVFAALKLKTLPSTESFVANHSLHFKKFVDLCDLLNANAKDTKRKLGAIRPKLLSPTKQKTPSATNTPSKSSKVTRKTAETKSAPENPDKESILASPTRRSTRLLDVLASTPPRQSPRTLQPIRSAVKIAQPLPFALRPGAKHRPQRELPSKKSPMKRPAEDSRVDGGQSNTVMDTPTKKPKLDSTPARTATLLLRSTTTSPTKKSMASTFPTIPVLLPQLVPASTEPEEDEPNPFLNSSSESEESDSDGAAPHCRFRPVYLEHKEWCAIDPRLASIRKKGRQALKTL